MNPKAGIILMGVLLVTGSMAGVMNIPEVPPKDFFVDPETGYPNVIIVVGEKAANLDVISAAMIAAKVCTISYPSEPVEVTFTDTYITVHENVDLLPNTRGLNDLWYSTLPDYVKDIGYPTVDVPDNSPYYNKERNTIPISYHLGGLWSFNDPNNFWTKDDSHFQPWESHEEIQIRFDDSGFIQDITDNNTDTCAIHLLGGDIPVDLPALVFDTWYTVPGLIYRVDNIFVPPVLLLNPEYGQSNYFELSENENERISQFCQKYTVLHMPEPWMVVNKRLPEFKMFDTVHTVVDSGPVLDINPVTGQKGPLHGTPYIVTGEPYYKTQVYLYQNKPRKFADYTVGLQKADIDNNKAWFKIIYEGTIIDTFTMVMDPYWCSFPSPPRKKYKLPYSIRENFPFSEYDAARDLNHNGVLDPGEITNITTYDYNQNGTPDYHKWVLDRAEEQLWAYHTWEYYTDDEGSPWLLFNTTGIAIEGIQVFVGAKGTVGVEVIMYFLDNPQYWYTHLCSDPWTTEPDYQMGLDAYQTGWDHIGGNQYMYQPPGTGLWPPSGLIQWQNEVGDTMFIGNGFLDNNDGHIGYEFNAIGILSDAYFPEQNDLDQDNGKTNDCKTSTWNTTANCTNVYDIEDPIVWHGPGLIMVEMNVCICDSVHTEDSDSTWVISGPILEDEPYFTIEILDPGFTCQDKSGIDYDTLMEVTQTRMLSTSVAIQWDEMALIETDAEFNFAQWKNTCSKNLILIGGPVANNIVKQVVNGGFSDIDWETSPGEWEFIPAPYNSCDILIVAGKNRSATRKAVDILIGCM
ncbi:MAG: S-layer protein [Candidatus Methanofastidiosia archaeon]